MVNIPGTADEWTLGTITDLLHDGYDESQTLEYKSSINPDGDRIGKTSCAFANTHGGFIIFGIDGDRKKNYHERIIGLDNSDQLKRQILDQINNIKPNLPLECIQFKKNNIHLPNGKVVIILRILPSDTGPHQFNNIFYKRLPDGNEPFSADEIINKIIETRKNSTLFNLLLSEAGVIRNTLKSAQIALEQNDVKNALTNCELISNDALHHFLYNQSFLYSDEFQHCLYTLVSATQKLSYDIGKAFDDIIEKEDTPEIKQLLANNNVKSADEFMKQYVQHIIKIALSSLDTLEKIINYKIPEPVNLFDSMDPNKQ